MHTEVNYWSLISRFFLIGTKVIFSTNIACNFVSEVNRFIIIIRKNQLKSILTRT